MHTGSLNVKVCYPLAKENTGIAGEKSGYTDM
jgi:hypothetical protein